MSGTGPVLSVVAPLHGNAATLRELVARTAATLGSLDWELLLVDDASPDGSADLARDIAAEEPRVRCFVQAHRQGQSEALRCGVRESRGRWVAFLDADLQDPPEVLPQLLAASAGVDVVFGIRRGAYQSWPRRLSSRLFKALRSVICRVPRGAGLLLLADGELLREIASRAAAPCRWIPLLGARALRMAAVPVERQPRPVGESAYRGLMRWRQGLGELVFAVRLRWGRGDSG